MISNDDILGHWSLHGSVREPGIHVTPSYKYIKLIFSYAVSNKNVF